MSGSLFERLTGSESYAHFDEDESIRQHLLRMFITRQGAVSTLPEYGLPDLNDLRQSRSELVKLICESLEHSIAAYEPRLQNVEVTYRPLSDATFALGFHIDAQKTGAGEELLPWQWNVYFENDKFRGGG